MHADSGTPAVPGFASNYPSGPVKREDFVGEDNNPTDRGWDVLKAFKAKQAAELVRLLRESGNRPVPVKDLLPGFNYRHVSGFNGASVAHGLWFRVVFIHKGIPLEQNELKLVPKTPL